MSDLRLLNSYEVFDYTPEMIKESVEKTGKIMVKGILQKADVVNQNGRIYPISILEREVRNYQKFIIENRALGECVPPGTEIYTVHGWKKIEEISNDEIIATINISTNELEFQRINKKIDLQYDGPMYRFKNVRTYDMCLTPEHKVLLWDRSGQPRKITARELYEAKNSGDSTLSHSGLRRAKATWTGEDHKTVNIAGKELDAEVWAAFLGIFLAEGHCSGVYSEKQLKKHIVAISQNEGDIAEQIRLLMKKLPWKHVEQVRHAGKNLSFVICDKLLHAHLLVLGGSNDKTVPNYVKGWSPRLLKTLVDWMLMGDGRHRTGRNGIFIDEYCTSSPKLAEDVYDIFLKLGHGATHHVFEPIDKRAPDFPETGRMILAENQVPMHIVCKSYSDGIALDFRFMQASIEEYSGRVYCVNVKNGTWLMRHNDKVCWTGNCDHPEDSVVNLKNVSHIVREAHLENGIVYGSVEILDKTPSGAILKGLIESGVKLGISSRGVGSTRKQGDYQVVQDDFQLICFDIVSEPSTSGAFMIPEGRSINKNDLRKVFTKSDRVDRILNDILSGR